MLLAIDCLLLSIEQYRLSKRLRDLTNNVVYLTFKDLSTEANRNMIIQITDKEMEKLLEFIDKGGKTIRLQSQTENIKVEIKR